MNRLKYAGLPHPSTLERHFQLTHALLLAFCALFVILHAAGIYLFTNGFLLSRLVLPDQSECSVPPIEIDSLHEIGSVERGCWHPKKFNKAVILLIDALRYDFTVPFRPTDNDRQPHYYHNALTVFHESASRRPQNAVLRPFIADPPTTTLQRLKALTTGTLPTFIDAGSNFAGTAIDEDTLILQLEILGKTVVHLGDDTWQALFPTSFDSNLSHPFPSLDVWDLHTVDNGVLQHLMPLLQDTDSGNWDIVIGHFLGVDHAGHEYGPDHPAMAAKLHQMDQAVRQAMALIDDETLLVVMGDHGMDTKGDHGGESSDEVEAALWMYAKSPTFGRSSAEALNVPSNAKERPVWQIDLVPTLALLLGLPVPFNNLGAPIEEAFLGVNGDDWENLAHVNRLTAAQMLRYQDAYAHVRELDPKLMAVPRIFWQSSEDLWNEYLPSKKLITGEQWRDLALASASYTEKTLSVFRGLWTRFGPVNMLQGISVTVCAMAVLLLLSRGFIASTNSLLFTWNAWAYQMLIGGALLGSVAGYTLSAGDIVCTALLSAAVSCLGFLSYAIFSKSFFFSLPIPASVTGWGCVLSVVLLCAGFAANSFTIWEDEILLYFIMCFGTLMLAQSLRLRSPESREQGLYHSLVFMVTIRLAAMSRLCREEQMPLCRQTYYASATSSTSAPWQLLIPYVIAASLPTVVKSYYARTGSYHGSATFWIGIAFRLCLLLIAMYWTLRAADDGEWLDLPKTMQRTIRESVSQLVLAIAFGAGTATFAWQAPPLHVQNIKPKASEPGRGSEIENTRPQLAIEGAGNLYGSHFALLPFTVLLIPLLLFQKPMGQAALALVAVAILSLLELLHLLGLIPHARDSATRRRKSDAVPAIGPTLLALLGHFAFFKTGHQATLASIQWDAAYIPLRTLKMPWSALFMVFNTFGGQILCAAAIPLVVLWRRPFNLNMNEREKKVERQTLLAAVGKAHLTHVLVYAAINLATTLWAAHLRRHLMLYRVFCPRWMLSAVSLIIVEIAGLVVGAGAFGWSVRSVFTLFGW